MDYIALAPLRQERRERDPPFWCIVCRDLRTQIAPDVKSKYDSLTPPARAIFPPSAAFSSPADSIGATNFLSAICIRASAVARALEEAPRLSFNLRGIILRMPRLVALLDEEENKLYSQVFSRGMGRTSAERRAKGLSMRTTAYFPGRISDIASLPRLISFSPVGPYKDVRCLLG